MITVELILDPTNWLEVNWLDVDVTPATYDEDGKEITQEVVSKKPVKSVSYHPTQLAMLQADAAELGTDLTEHEALLADWVASYVPPDPEPVQVPQVVTIRQAKLALLQAGLLDDVDAAIAQADRATQIEWEYATEVHRNWPTLRSVQGAVGLTDEQVDELFIRAASL